MYCNRRIVVVIVNLDFYAPTKAKSREPAYLQALTKSISSGLDPESQAGRQPDGYGERCLELRQGGRETRMNQDRILLKSGVFSLE